MVSITHIGDIVLSCPTARALKKAYPSAEIDMLVSMPQGEAAFHNPYIHSVIDYTIKDWQRDRIKLIALIERLRLQQYDIALSSPYGSANPMMAWLSGAACRIGFDVHCGARYLTHIIPTAAPTIRHETENQLRVLAPLGITTEDTRIEYTLSAADIAGMYEKLPELLARCRPLVLLCPFSDDKQKNWTHSGYTAVLKTLADFTDCCLIGAHNQLSELTAINCSTGNRATVLAGTLTLGELGALIQEADLLITVDTGPMHIAQAFETPVIALMGPTDPRIWGPRKPNDVIINKSLPCSPCWHKDEAIKKSCCRSYCMQCIQPAEVIYAAKKSLHP